MTTATKHPECLLIVHNEVMGRRNLSPAQKKEAHRKMKEVARALREEDPKKNTQARVAKLLGVARQTVTDWLAPKGSATNAGSGNGCPCPDARVKVNPAQKPVIAERVAKLLGVDQTTVSLWFCKDHATNTSARNGCPCPDARVKVNPAHKSVIAERVAAGVLKASCLPPSTKPWRTAWRSRGPSNLPITWTCRTCTVTATPSRWQCRFARAMARSSSAGISRAMWKPPGLAWPKSKGGM